MKQCGGTFPTKIKVWTFHSVDGNFCSLPWFIQTCKINYIKTNCRPRLWEEFQRAELCQASEGVQARVRHQAPRVQIHFSSGHVFKFCQNFAYCWNNMSTKFKNNFEWLLHHFDSFMGRSCRRTFRGQIHCQEVRAGLLSLLVHHWIILVQSVRNHLLQIKHKRFDIKEARLADLKKEDGGHVLNDNSRGQR